MSVAAAPAQIAVVRHALRRFLDRHPLTDQSVDDVVLIVSELTTNAVHASPSAGDVVDVRVVVARDAIDIEVDDRGSTAFSVIPTDLPDTRATRGRGLPIVSRLADQLDVVQADGVTRVSVRYCEAV